MGNIVVKVDAFRTIFVFLVETFRFLRCFSIFFVILGSCLLWRCWAAPPGAPGRAPGRPGVLLDVVQMPFGTFFGTGYKQDFGGRPDEGCPSALLSKVPLDPSLERGPAGL